MKTTQIEISCRTGKEKIQAVMVGKFFAVHPPQEALLNSVFDKDAWRGWKNLTHLPSGLRLCAVKTIQKGREIARKVEAKYPEIGEYKKQARLGKKNPMRKFLEEIVAENNGYIKG